MQVEYATDIVFRRQPELAPIYEALVRTAVHAVKAENVAMFLGRKLNGGYRDEWSPANIRLTFIRSAAVLPFPRCAG
jgi:hypothetical protein